jgi:hypothetical protein
MKQNDDGEDDLALFLRIAETRLVNSFLIGSEFPYESRSREHRRERVRLS